MNLIPNYFVYPQQLSLKNYGTAFSLEQVEITFKYFIIKKLTIMLRWTVTFLIVAIVAAIFGFGGIAAGAASIAKILFFIFIALFLVSLVFGKSLDRS